MLFMLEILQVVKYFKTYPKDSRYLRIIIVLLFTNEIISEVAEYACVYLVCCIDFLKDYALIFISQYCVTHWGKNSGSLLDIALNWPSARWCSLSYGTVLANPSLCFNHWMLRCYHSVFLGIPVLALVCFFINLSSTKHKTESMIAAQIFQACDSNISTFSCPDRGA